MLSARSAFAGLLPAADGGFIATEREDLAVASLSVRRGRRAELQTRLTGRFAITLPDGPHRHVSGALAALGSGPGTWLITGPAQVSFVNDLIATVGDSASVTDQSDAYAVLRLAGPALRGVLAKLVPIDVHPRAFRIGDVAVTVLSHMGALLWRLDDDAAGQPVMELAVYRSYAASLAHELSCHS